MVENFEHTDDDNIKKDMGEAIKADPEFSEHEIVRSFNTISPDEIKGIDFGYENIKNNPDFILNLINQYEGDNSLAGLLAHNEQIQSLLDDILSNYGNYVKQDETALRKVIQEKKNSNSEEGEMVECFEEYLLNNDSQEGFEQYLLSNKCITGVLLPYFNGLINSETKELNNNLISKNNIKAKIKAEWYKKLYMDYNEKYDLKLDNQSDNLRNLGNLFKNMADNLVSQYLNGTRDEEFLKTLEGFITNTQNNENFRDILKSDHFNFLLRNSIKEYSRILNIGNENRKLHKTDDKVFDVQLRTYLFMYGMIFYPDVFKSNGGLLDDYEGDLGKILEAILIADLRLDKSDNNEEENKYIQAEGIFQSGLKNRDKSMRQNARRIRREKYNIEKDSSQFLDKDESGTLDIQNASGVEIAQEINLGKSLSGFKMKEIQSDANTIFRKKTAFWKTCRDFRIKNGETLHQFDLKISDLISLNNDFNLSVNYNKLEKLKEKLNDSELNEVKTLINGFIEEFHANLKKTEKNMDSKKEAVHNVVKEYAIGAVIDNIKDMFKNIVGSNEGNYLNGFEFNEKESAKIENNNLIISGKFNGENLILKYDLINGALYMNSYISKISNDTMVIGDNSPILKIGELKPFQDILDSFYDRPTESMSNDAFSKYVNRSQPQIKLEQNGNNGEPKRQRSPHRRFEARKRMKAEHKQKLQQICGTKLDELGGEVKNQAESKTTQNYAVSNLLKSLNIMSEDSNYEKTINLRTNSDLYKTVQTITNSENKDINYFSNYLGKLMDYIGLKWGKNNLLGQDKTTEDAKLIFDNNNSGETVKYLRGKTENFNDEYSISNGKSVFDSGTNFGILDVINENFIEGTPPNGQLKIDKIENFDKELTKDLKYYKQVSEQQKEREKSEKITEIHDKQSEKEKEDADDFLEEQLLSID